MEASSINTFYFGILAVGLLVLVLGVFSGTFRERWYLNQFLVALVAGVLLGPAVFGVIDPAQWRNERTILEAAGLLTLAVADMSVAVGLPRGYLSKEWKSLAIVLGVVMPVMALVSGLVIFALTALPFWLAMLAGAVTVPTDPVIANSILTGRVARAHIPARIRHLVSAESGANDAVIFPLIMLLLFAVAPVADGFAGWAARIVLWQVGAALPLGVALGYAAAGLRNRSLATGAAEEVSALPFVAALALVALGVAMLLQLDALLTVFAAGIVYRRAVHLSGSRTGETKFEQALRLFFIFPVVALFGTAIPWSAWWELGWRGIALALILLFVRRLPAVLMLARFTPALQSRKDALLVGWFGPVGIDTFYFALFVVGWTGSGDVWAIASLLIVTSVLIHGWTATPLARRLGETRNRGDQRS